MSLLFLPFVLFYFYLQPSHELILDVSQQGLDKILPNYLFLFVMYYNKKCTEYSEIPAFVEAERIAEEIGLSRSYDLKFVQMDLGANSFDTTKIYLNGIPTSPPCSGPPKFKLWKYGKPINYGTEEQGEWLLSKEGKTTTGMFAWLENQTKSRVVVLTTEEDKKVWVAGNEFSVLGYFKGHSGEFNRHNYYQAAERLKGYNIAEIRNHSLFEADYGRDTIVVNQQFGKLRKRKPDTDTDFTSRAIETFIKENAKYSGPVWKFSFEQLDAAIRQTLVVFALFIPDYCEMPETFYSVAETGAGSGMLEYLNMKFARVGIPSQSQHLDKYGLRTEVIDQGCANPENTMRLFKYGRVIKYDANLSTQKGMVNWLDSVTKPAAKPILTLQDFKLVVEYNEVSIVGYFQNLQNASKTRMEFYKAADQLKDYIWGDVLTKELNPYFSNTIVLYRNFGEIQSDIMPVKETLTSSEITEFVQRETFNTKLPVPTRPTPSPPPPPKSDLEYKNDKVVAMFDGKEFQGNKIFVDLSPGGCIQIPLEWGKGTLSINTFGECVDFYERPGCQITDPPQPGRSKFRLDPTLTNANQDLTRVKSLGGGFQSLQFCPSDAFGSWVKLALTGLFIGCVVLFCMARKAVRTTDPQA